MNDLAKKIREYYGEKALSEEKIGAILARSGGARSRFAVYIPAIAAAAVLVIGVLVGHYASQQVPEPIAAPEPVAWPEPAAGPESARAVLADSADRQGDARFRVSADLTGQPSADGGNPPPDSLLTASSRDGSSEEDRKREPPPESAPDRPTSPRRSPPSAGSGPSHSYGIAPGGIPGSR